MNMVLVGVHCMEVERGIFSRGFVEVPYQLITDVVFQIFATIFSTPDNMILMFIGTVIQALDSHEISISN